MNELEQQADMIRRDLFAWADAIGLSGYVRLNKALKLLKSWDASKRLPTAQGQGITRALIEPRRCIGTLKYGKLDISSLPAMEDMVLLEEAIKHLVYALRDRTRFNLDHAREALTKIENRVRSCAVPYSARPWFSHHKDHEGHNA